MTTINKTFYFLSGLPRSGSTVLAAILNQNDKIYVTPTSPLLDQLIENQNIWHSLPSVKDNPIPDQLTNITRRLIKAMYSHIPQNIIIDKNRGWGKNMPASTILFEKKIKMIATTRDLPSIMASWLTLLRNNPRNNLDREIMQKGYTVNDDNRMLFMWNEMVRDCMESLSQAKQDASDRLLLIGYDELINDPRNILKQITDFLQLPTYDYDFDNITSLTKDDDLSAWGLDGMHTVRSKLHKISKDPQTVLGKTLYDRFVELEQEYM